MNVPERIQVQLICDGHLELDKIILQVEVISGTKNHYHIHFPKTDKSGTTTLTKKDFIGQFEEHFENGLMDFNGSIETANSIVEISLFDPSYIINNKREYLAWDLFENEKLSWNSREEKYDYIASCSNLEFECSPVSIDLEKVFFVGLKIRKK